MSLNKEDFIGVERSIEVRLYDTSSLENGGVRRQRERRREMEFPPPLPPRAALKRYCTCDGRLVIELGRLPKILRARRENNRLTIDLISLEGDFESDSGDETSNDRMEKEESVSRVYKYDFGMDGGDEGGVDRTVEDEDEETGRIYKYDYGVRSNPCMVGIVVPAIRHVPI